MMHIYASLIMLLGIFLAREAHAALPSFPDKTSYRLTFSDDFGTPSTIASAPSNYGEARWYRKFFFGQPETPLEFIHVADGVLYMQSRDGTGVNLVTAAPAATADGWRGRVFRDGAYFEARIALGPDLEPESGHWPTFWTMSIEHMALKGAARWPGEDPDFMRFIESDIFEYNPNWQSGAYYSTIHEWYGRWQSCPTNQWCHESNAEDERRMIRMWPASEFQKFHVYGQLWVPAKSDTPGYLQSYLDGRPVGVRVEWEIGQPRPPAGGRRLFNVIDRQGLVLILTTGSQEMQVDWVRVWQPPTGHVDSR